MLSLILYLKGMRITMFQLSGFWYIVYRVHYKIYPKAERPPKTGQSVISDPTHKPRNPDSAEAKASQAIGSPRCLHVGSSLN